MKKIVVLVCAHKPYPMPEDEMYLPVHVGAEGKETIGFTKDNTGNNLSSKNACYSELTGLYWAWKNLDAEYVGLVHYRRHFSVSGSVSGSVTDRLKNVLNTSEAEELLEKTDIILPKKREYFVENLYSHYVHTLQGEPLDKTGGIIKEKYPDYYPEFEKLHKRTSAHMFNMFIMKKDKLDSYCQWLFDILFELENRVDMTKYDDFQARFFGRISELLLDVWINTNKLDYEEVKVINMEKVNWVKKGTAFLLAKFTGKKYGESF